MKEILLFLCKDFSNTRFKPTLIFSLEVYFYCPLLAKLEITSSKSIDLVVSLSIDNMTRLESRV